jgi:hypothetical protein
MPPVADSKLSNLQFQSLQIPSLQIPSIADPKSANSKFADSLCSDWCGVRCRGRRLDYFGGSASGRGDRRGRILSADWQIFRFFTWPPTSSRSDGTAHASSGGG